MPVNFLTDHILDVHRFCEEERGGVRKRQLFIVVPKLSLGMKILHDCEKICTTQQFLLEI